MGLLSALVHFVWRIHRSPSFSNPNVIDICCPTMLFIRTYWSHINHTRRHNHGKYEITRWTRYFLEGDTTHILRNIHTAGLKKHIYSTIISISFPPKLRISRCYPLILTDDKKKLVGCFPLPSVHFLKYWHISMFSINWQRWVITVSVQSQQVSNIISFAINLRRTFWTVQWAAFLSV